jgi:cytochrome c553
LAIGILALLPAAASAEETKFSAAQIEFFENKIRPLLAEHCYECHSERSDTVQGGLRLDGRAWILTGGDSGPAISVGNADESLLVEAVRWESFEMPPKGKLSDEQVAALVRWVEMQAPWPPEGDTSQIDVSVVYDWKRLRDEHWAFRPVEKPPLPEIDDDDWILNAIDHFVLARLRTAGLEPAPPAAPRTLIRRIYFDLVGLPPTPAEVQVFVDAATADRGAAISSVVDRLLASPRYGERWARHWLDVARYSDGHGGFLDNAALPQAWRFRDWVVQAFNDDLPFDQFIRLQVAGDLTSDQPDVIATGFFALGPTYRSDGGDPESVAQAKAETLSDRVDTLGRGILGLTLACARCHDHKFDPVPQADYYSLAGVFNNTRVQETPISPPEVVKAYNDHQQAIKELDGKLKQRQNELKKAGREPTDEETRQSDQWRKELEQLQKTTPPKYDFAHALTDSGNADMQVAIRGDLRRTGEVAPRRFLRILAGADPPRFTRGSGRLELAEALTDPRNPLTPRVFVNRVWLHHFGEGLVRTPSNFGRLGEEPTHPKLLDWLTGTFMESGWSVKQLHRTVISSATYQMSTRYDEGNYQADGDNRLLWRMNPRRLDVEAWRDSVLAITDELQREPGGPPTSQIDSLRRTLYFQVSRNGDQFPPDAFLRLFDFPLMRASVARRPTSIVPQQYLFMMNSPFMRQRAKSLVERLNRETRDERARIDLAYRLLYCRPPTVEETQQGLAYVQADSGSPAADRWQRYAQVLISANEFLFVQ